MINLRIFRILLALVLVFATLAAFAWMFKYILIEYEMKPEARAQYRAWKKDPINLPKDALDVEPFQEATVQAAEDFRKTYAALKTRTDETLQELKANRRDPFEAVFQSTATLPTRQLDELTPLVTAFENLVKQPDYQIEADSAGLIFKEESKDAAYSLGGLPILNLSRIQSAARLMALKVIQLAREGKAAEALAESALIIKAAQTSPYAEIISQLSGIAICSLGTRTWDYAVERTNDPQLLENALKLMKDFAETQTYFPEKLFIRNLDEIGTLRWLNRQGWTIPAIQGVTGPELCWRTYATEANYIREVVLPRIKEDPALKNRQQEAMNGVTTLYNAAYGMGPLHVPSETIKSHPFTAVNFALSHELDRKTLFNISIPNGDEARLRGKTAIARFNLLRLKTARKLYRLREGREAPNAAALTPKYLPKLPEDPFDSKTKTFKFRKVDYSLGPDGVDQKAADCYDPTNGTQSPGDIFLK